jgi:hypothetical protein
VSHTFIQLLLLYTCHMPSSHGSELRHFDLTAGRCVFSLRRRDGRGSRKRGKGEPLLAIFGPVSPVPSG